MPGRRVGVLGGTFDPVHIGHLVTAMEVRSALRLDVVLLVVANLPWQKVGAREITPAADRLAVVEAAVAGVVGIEASAVEIDRGGTTYTADTLAALADAEPDIELFLVVGADVAGELHTWKRIGELQRGATLVVVGRPGAAAPAAAALREGGWRVEEVPVPALDVSSTDLRARVATGRPIDFLVPAAAVREIRERGLYAPR
jgi:nicotinate-nucleotide adenylyltransferase